MTLYIIMHAHRAIPVAAWVSWRSGFAGGMAREIHSEMPPPLCIAGAAVAGTSGSCYDGVLGARVTDTRREARALSETPYQ